MAEIGRNAPCPCGSGRKHKKCCLREKETGAQKIGDLRYMLAGFAVQTTPREDLEAAWRDFRDTDEPLEAFLSKPGERMAPFLDWLTKGRRFAGRTVLERFEERVAEGLSDEDRRELEEIKATRYAVFEVVKTRPGEGLSVVDIFSGERQEVRDISASRRASAWDVLTAWVAPGTDRFEFWGQARIFRPQDKDDIRAELKAAYEHERTVEPDLSWQAFLNAATPLLDRLQTRLLSESRRLFTPEGDPLCPSTAVYAVADFSAALRALRGRRELEEDSNRMGEDDHLEEVSFDWMGELPQVQRPSGNGILFSTQRINPDGSQPENRLANIVLTRTELRVECLSRRRLAAARSVVEKIDKKSLRLLREDFQPYETIDAPGRPRPSEREEKPGPALIAVQAAALMEYAEDWLRQPIPALDDRSPLEAAKDAPGRAKLTELLKIFEHRDAEHGNGEGFSNPSAPCQTAMRRLLGLSIPPELSAREKRLRELAANAGKDSGDPLVEKFRKAQALHQEGRVEEALRAYESLKAALRSHRTKHQLWANMGICHLSAGRFAEGIRCLETALEIMPDYEFAATNLARARRFVLRPRRKPNSKSRKSGKE